MVSFIYFDEALARIGTSGEEVKCDPRRKKENDKVSTNK